MNVTYRDRDGFYLQRYNTQHDNGLTTSLVLVGVGDLGGLGAKGWVEEVDVRVEVLITIP
jgi:hypothetical protein